MGNKNKLIFVSKYENYLDYIMEDLDKKEKVCYITLNKSYNYLVSVLIEKGFNENNFYFIDGITSVLSKPEGKKNCEFIKNASDLDSILIAVKKMLNKGYNTIIIDSVSNIFDYEAKIDPTSLFIRHLANLVKGNGSLTIVCDKKDKSKISDYKLYKIVDLYESSFWPLGMAEK